MTASAPLTDLQALQQGVYKDPEDWHLRRVLADAYEDQGKPGEAAALRWMADNQKRAWFRAQFGEWAWFDVDQCDDRGRLMDPRSDLPHSLFSRFNGWRQGGVLFSFRQVREAEDAFVEAFIKWDAEGRP